MLSYKGETMWRTIPVDPRTHCMSQLRHRRWLSPRECDVGGVPIRLPLSGKVGGKVGRILSSFLQGLAAH